MSAWQPISTAPPEPPAMTFHEDRSRPNTPSWRDAPDRCTRCEHVFADHGDPVSIIDDEPYCEWCAEKFGPDAINAICDALADIGMFAGNKMEKAA